MSFDITQRDSEGRVIYFNPPYRESHPSRLATVAALRGLQPASVDQCRVLELGCAVGGNLLPMAELLPNSEFVGIDVNEAQITWGRNTMEALGLKNLELGVLDIMDVGASFGEFDYIICHGVFSWTTRGVQDKILAICKRNLARNGIAYINYNTYPGWHIEGLVRDMIRYGAMNIDDPQQRVRQARKTATLMRQICSSQQNAFCEFLGSSLQALSQHPSGVLFHAYLDVLNQPIYFHEFVEWAEGQGLQYVGDANPEMLLPGSQPPSIEPALNELAENEIQRGQYLDFVHNRSSRRSLLCHGELSIPDKLDPRHLAGLYVCGSLPVETSSTGAATVRRPNGQWVSTLNQNLITALKALSIRGHQGMQFETLQSLVAENENAQPWVEDLVRCFAAAIIDISVMPRPYTMEVASRPLTTQLARLQAEAGSMISNLAHSVVEVTEIDRQILQLLDGQHDHRELAAQLPEGKLPGCLQRLAAAALLQNVEQSRSPEETHP